MKKIITLLLILFSQPVSAMTLWDYYGGKLPSLSERAVTYGQYYDDEYKGTKNQNVKLLSELTQPMRFGGFNNSASFSNSPVQLKRQSLASATTTPCVISSLTGTSTILKFAADINVGTSSAGTLVLATTTNNSYATSSMSILGTYTVGANNTATIRWTPQTGNGLFAPNTNLVLGMTNGSTVNYAYTYGGSCQTLLSSDI